MQTFLLCNKELVVLRSDPVLSTRIANNVKCMYWKFGLHYIEVNGSD